MKIQVFEGLCVFVIRLGVRGRFPIKTVALYIFGSKHINSESGIPATNSD